MRLDKMPFTDLSFAQMSLLRTDPSLQRSKLSLLQKCHHRVLIPYIFLSQVYFDLLQRLIECSPAAKHFWPKLHLQQMLLAKSWNGHMVSNSG